MEERHECLRAKWLRGRMSQALQYGQRVVVVPKRRAMRSMRETRGTWIVMVVVMAGILDSYLWPMALN